MSLEREATDWIDGAIAQALMALQSANPTVGGVPQHTDRAPGQWAELLEPVAPAIAEVARRVAKELPVAPEHDGIVLLHGDLHDGNVFLDQRRGIGMIDLDSLAVGHPAVDPGNLAAHFVLRALQRGKPAGDGDRRASTFLAAYRSAGGRAEPAELACAVAHCLHRLACVYAVRPPWAHLAPSLLGHAQRWVVKATA